MSGSDPQNLVARYFVMWNTGDHLIAKEILAPDWVDHAHPEMTGLSSITRAVDQVRAAQPGLRFQIETILANGSLAAAVGSVSRGTDTDARPVRCIWLVQTYAGRMTEMWTYHAEPATGHPIATPPVL